jgi:hypothetical protein
MNSEDRERFKSVLEPPPQCPRCGFNLTPDTAETERLNKYIKKVYEERLAKRQSPWWIPKQILKGLFWVILGGFAIWGIIWGVILKPIEEDYRGFYIETEDGKVPAQWFKHSYKVEFYDADKDSRRTLKGGYESAAEAEEWVDKWWKENLHQDEK